MLNCDKIVNHVNRPYFFRDTKITDDQNFTVPNGLGYMAIHRATLMSKGRVVEDMNYYNYTSYVNVITKLPAEYRGRVLTVTTMLTGESWPSSYPEILTSALAGERRGALNRGKIVELLVPVLLSSLTTTRLIPTASQLSLNFQLEGMHCFSQNYDLNANVVDSKFLMMPEAGKVLRLALLSADLIAELVELTTDAQQRIKAELHSGGSLSIPIQASELYTFSVPKDQQENATPSITLSASTRMLSIFFLYEKAMLGALDENPMRMYHMGLRKLRINYGAKVQERIFSFTTDDGNVRLGYLQTLNALGGGVNESTFVTLDEWTDSNCIHVFDVTSSNLVGNCLEIRPNADSAQKSFSISYEFVRALANPCQLVMIVQKDKAILIRPDYSLELVDSV